MPACRFAPFALLLIGAVCAAPEAPVSPAAPDSLAAPESVATPLAGEADEHTAGPDTWTAGIVEEQRDSAVPGRLVAVRTAPHAGFDRIVFEFEGDVPGYHVEYVDRPVYACGSGEVVPVAGEGWLEMRLTPTAAHTEDGEPTITAREQAPDLPVLRELVLTCDFEADVTWVGGVASPNPFRAFTLRDPARLVVDVRH